MKRKSILDPTFKYVPSHSTDIRKTFARVRKQQKYEQDYAKRVKWFPEGELGRRLAMFDQLVVAPDVEELFNWGMSVDFIGLPKIEEIEVKPLEVLDFLNEEPTQAQKDIQNVWCGTFLDNPKIDWQVELKKVLAGPAGRGRWLKSVK